MALLVKLAALGFVLLLDPAFAIDLQLLGGIWVLQTFPALVSCVLPAPLERASGSSHAVPLLSGWAAGMALGTALVAFDGLRPVHVLAMAGFRLQISTALIALAANFAVVVLVGAVRRGGVARR